MKDKLPVELQALVTEFQKRLASGDRPPLREFLREGQEQNVELLLALIASEVKYLAERANNLDTSHYSSEFADILKTDEQLAELAAILEGVRHGDERAGDGSDAAPRIEDVSPAERTLILTPEELRLRHEQAAYEDSRPDSDNARYRIEEEVGIGGQGRVSRAFDQRLRRNIAIKEIRPDTTKNGVSTPMSRSAQLRLRREALVAAQLQHPNIIPVYDLDEEPQEDHLYFCMKFLRGRELKDDIREHHANRDKPEIERQESLRQLVRQLILACRGIDFANEHGVVHRDVKPDNIKTGGHGEVIVYDWGLAKIDPGSGMPEEVTQVDVSSAGDSETRSGSVVGTPSYMAPEQALGLNEQTDGRTDVYGLGAILFEILTGRAPHGKTGLSLRALLDRIATSEPPDPRKEDDSVPPALAAICMKAMALEKPDRYQTAAELEFDLTKWLEDDDIGVYQRPRVDRILRWMRSHRHWAVSLTLLLVTIAIVSAFAAYRINLARGREARARTMTRETMDVSLTGMDDALRFFPSTHNVRRRLLEQAARDYEKLAILDTDDLQLQIEAIRAQSRLARLHLLLNDRKAALASWTKAEKALDQHADDPAFSDALSVERARVYAGLAATHFGSGQLGESARYYKQAMAYVDSPQARGEQRPARRSTLSRIRIDYSLLLRELGTFNVAQQQLDTAIGELSGVLEVNDDIQCRGTLATAWHALGQLQMGQSLFVAGRESLTNGLVEFQTLLLAETSHPVWLDGRALCQISLANCARQLGHDSEALAAYEEAVLAMSDLAKAIPGVPHYQHMRVVAITNQALFLHALYRGASALPFAEEAMLLSIQLSDSADSPLVYQKTGAVSHAAYGITLLQLGDYANAIEALSIAWKLYAELTGDGLDRDARRQTAILSGLLARAYVEESENLTDDAQAEFAAARKELSSLANDKLDHASANALAWVCL